MLGAVALEIRCVSKRSICRRGYLLNSSVQHKGPWLDTGKAYMEHGLVYAGVQYVITIDILMSDVNIVQL